MGWKRMALYALALFASTLAAEADEIDDLVVKLRTERGGRWTNETTRVLVLPQSTDLKELAQAYFDLKAGHQEWHEVRSVFVTRSVNLGSSGKELITAALVESKTGDLILFTEWWERGKCWRVTSYPSVDPEEAARKAGWMGVVQYKIKRGWESPIWPEHPRFHAYAPPSLKLYLSAFPLFLLLVVLFQLWRCESVAMAVLLFVALAPFLAGTGWWLWLKHYTVGGWAMSGEEPEAVWMRLSDSFEEGVAISAMLILLVAIRTAILVCSKRSEA